MELRLIKSLWGMQGSLDEQFEKIAAAGYSGVEDDVPVSGKAAEFKSLLKKYNLDYIAMIYTEGDHLSSFENQLHQALEFDPILVNSQSANDHMTFDEQLRFFERALHLEQQLGIPVAHETHRGRAMYSSWSTAKLLNQFPDLRINADFSHWCCVSESLLQDQEDLLRISIARSIHIHGRVGYAQGPQVPDPRAPEYLTELLAHDSWWNRICEEQFKSGRKQITFTPEFGPHPYMPTLPYTNMPVSDLWEVCLWMAERFKTWFEKKYS